MNLTEIMDVLPHRYPFLLVDRVVELVKGERIIAYKNITGNEEVFNGHFPGAPIFPGVMIVEALAQASGILGFVTTDTTADDGKLYLFAGVDNVRFKTPVVPGDQLEIKANLVKVRGNKLATAEVTCLVAGQVVSSASLMFAITDAAES